MKRLNKLQRHASIRSKDAESQLVTINQNSYTKIRSDNFVNELENHTSLEQLFNKLMLTLLFFEMGRYRSCPIIGPSRNAY